MEFNIIITASDLPSKLSAAITMFFVVTKFLKEVFNLKSFWKGVGECRRIQSYKALTKVCHLIRRRIVTISSDGDYEDG